jgi:hypothetical protein
MHRAIESVIELLLGCSSYSENRFSEHCVHRQKGYLEYAAGEGD